MSHREVSAKCVLVERRRVTRSMFGFSRRGAHHSTSQAASLSSPCVFCRPGVRQPMDRSRNDECWAFSGRQDASKSVRPAGQLLLSEQRDGHACSSDAAHSQGQTLYLVANSVGPRRNCNSMPCNHREGKFWSPRLLNGGLRLVPTYRFSA